jgi:hypothetical protein
MTAQCSQCEALMINGVYCHETGCPEAWRDERRECGWCGQVFRPEIHHAICCDDSCYRSLNGLPCAQEEGE